MTKLSCTDLAELVLAGDAGHLHVALDLLADLLVAVHDGHAGDGVDPAHREAPGPALLKKCYHFSVYKHTYRTS